MFVVQFFITASGRKPVQEFILDQDEQAQEKLYEVLGYFQEFGFHLPTTYLRRMSGSKRLWELRAKSRSQQYRIFVAKVSDQTIVLLHAIIKKTAKTPRRDIETAEDRLRLSQEGAL